MYDGAVSLALGPQVAASAVRDTWGTRPLGPAALHLLLATRHRTPEVPTFLNIDLASIHFIGLRGEKARAAVARLRGEAQSG